jgi:hypothetical protein
MYVISRVPSDNLRMSGARTGSRDATALHKSPAPPPMTFQFGLSAKEFRFHCTLNAPTAMIKHADDNPVTYLNKGEVYSLSIIDTAPTDPLAQGVKYRTFVRVSFDDEQQRAKPGVCWNLWKEGRGTNEAYYHGGKFRAVDYIEVQQPAEGDDEGCRVEVESVSFDNFA